MFLFLLPTPHIIGEPLEFLIASIEHIAFWSKAEGQLDSFSHWKEDLWEAKRSWSNFYAIVVPWQQHDLPLDGEPDPSSIPLLSIVPLPLPVFSMPLPPIVSALLFLSLFRLGIQGVPFFPAIKAGLPPQHVFLLTQPHRAHHQSQRG